MPRPARRPRRTCGATAPPSSPGDGDTPPGHQPPGQRSEALAVGNIAGIDDLENYRVLEQTAEYVSIGKSLPDAETVEGDDGSRSNFRYVTIMSPGNPREPFTVPLDAPQGNERVPDSAVYPARPFLTTQPELF